jgi:hypothetical protein
MMTPPRTLDLSMMELPFPYPLRPLPYQLIQTRPHEIVRRNRHAVLDLSIEREKPWLDESWDSRSVDIAGASSI